MNVSDHSGAPDGTQCNMLCFVSPARRHRKHVLAFDFRQEGGRQTLLHYQLGMLAKLRKVVGCNVFYFSTMVQELTENVLVGDILW